MASDSSTLSSSQIDSYLDCFFEFLSTIHRKRHFFVCLEHVSDIDSDFLSLFVLILRYRNLSSPFLEFIVDESVSSVKSPSEMFWIDHVFTHIMREFVHQTLGNSLADWLRHILCYLNQEATPAEIGTCATRLFKRLYQFRFPTEAKSFFVTLASLINHRFPTQSPSGLSEIFFLRSLCPLIMTSPISFELPDTPTYHQNASQLTKIIHNIANGIVPTDVSSDMLLIHMEHQQLMTDFLARLASPTDTSGFPIPSSMYSDLAIASSAQVSSFLDGAIKTIANYFHEQKVVDADDEWQAFVMSWRAFQIEITDADSLASDSSSQSSSSELSRSDRERRPRTRAKDRKPSVEGTSKSSKSPVKERLKRTGSALLFFRKRRGSNSSLSLVEHAHPELFSRRRSSTTALPTSPRVESARIALRLNINRARHLLRSLQSSLANAGEIILHLGQIAGLLQDGDAPKPAGLPQVLVAFATAVAEFVDSLNSRCLTEAILARLRTFLDRFEAEISVGYS